MLIEKKPLKVFIKEAYNRNYQFKKIIDAWAIDTENVFGILEKYYGEMGIFFIYPTQEHMMIDNILAFIRKSPEINSLKQQAKKLEKKKKSNLHSN